MAARSKKSAKTVARKSRKRSLFAHHRHNFKLLPSHHTNYATLTFILLLVGVFCYGWIGYAAGADYEVTAIVPAPLLPTGAIITSPHDGDVLYTSPITVDGTCPPNSYINLYRNDIFSGTTLCQSDNTWHIETSLDSGDNKLFAQDYNITNQAGPVTSSITVTYAPPAAPSQPATGSSGSSGSSGSKSNGSAASTTPLVLSGSYSYQGVNVGRPATVQLSITGGQSPYAVSIDWGDGNSDLSSRSGAGAFGLTHTYREAGGYHYGYTIIVKATDSAGQNSLLQLLAIITPPQFNGGTVMSSGQNPSSTLPYHGFWKVAGPVYGVAILALISFWLGERREIELFKRPKPRRPNRLRPA